MSSTALFANRHRPAEIEAMTVLAGPPLEITDNEDSRFDGNFSEFGPISPSNGEKRIFLSGACEQFPVASPNGNFRRRNRELFS
jgi:hypothetical protein